MHKTMTYEELELNGCYAMLCEALRAWHRIQHDHTREIAAKTLKDVYGYEFHLNGGSPNMRKRHTAAPIRRSPSPPIVRTSRSCSTPTRASTSRSSDV